MIQSPVYSSAAKPDVTHTSCNGAKMGDQTDYLSPDSLVGWSISVPGTGPVLGVNIDAGGTGYANNEVLVFTTTGITPTANAAGYITTDASGVITSVTLTSGGEGYNGVDFTSVDVTTAAGTGASLSLVMGGRANRYMNELLVAGSIPTS